MSLIRHGAKALFAAADVFLPNPPGPRVLIFHQVGAGLGRQMEVTVEAFTRQLDWLGENRGVVGLETAVARWHEPESENLVVLTFDDGYRDTYATAYPLLKERGFPFTLYLSTQSIDTGQAVGPSPQADPLTWSQVEEMVASGLVTVGSHTHRHTDLRQAPPDQIEEELATCDALIEQHLGIVPRHFAYPWGHWSDRADATVRDRYETAALGASPRRVSSHDAHMIHRYPVQLSDHFVWFRHRLRGGFLVEERLRRWLRS